MTTVSNTPFLRKILVADGVTGAAASVLCIAGAGVLAPLLALPQPLLFWAGVALVPFAVALFAMARMQHLPRGWLTALVAANIGWAAASVAILAGGLVSPNVPGTLFVLAQAAAVALFAVLQATALRREHEAAL